MSDEEAGAWALGAVTAWRYVPFLFLVLLLCIWVNLRCVVDRAVVTKAQIEKGHNVLIVCSCLSVLLIVLIAIDRRVSAEE
jgi:hypothetical protein